MVMRSKLKPLVIICLDCGRKRPHCAKGLCKQCYNRHWRKENPNYLRHWREKNPNYDRHWRKEHQEKKAASARRYYEAHQEKEIIRSRHWRKENPEKAAAQFARRQAHKNATPDTLTPGQIRRLFVIGQAMYPGKNLHLDHIIPLSKGGGTTLANMHAIPSGLNLSKYNKLPEEVYKQLSFQA